MSTAQPFPLSRPITVNNLTVTSLPLDTAFKVGWLRGAPKVPTWFVGLVKGALAGLSPEEGDQATAASIDKTSIDRMLAAIPTPSGEEVSEMVPWLLHIAEKATGQPPAVVDQLGLGDLLGIILQLVPGMLALANFPKTSANGAATSPGSSAGVRPT